MAQWDGDDDAAKLRLMNLKNYPLGISAWSNTQAMMPFGIVCVGDQSSTNNWHRERATRDIESSFGIIIIIFRFSVQIQINESKQSKHCVL